MVEEHGLILLTVIQWLVRLLMLPIVVFRKEKPVTCLAWLCIIFFEPFLGLFLYLLLGENRLGRLRRRRRARRFGTFEAAGHPDVDPRDRVAEGEIDERHIVAHLAEKVGGLSLVAGNRVEILADNDAVLGRLLKEIESARDHVHLLFYIFQDDETGRRVTDGLRDARNRGVECRLLADQVGSWDFLAKRAPSIRETGVQVVAGLPVGRFRRRLARIDMRNHRKLAIIDGKVGYVGSQNILDACFGHRRAGCWRDVMARVEGPVVRQLQTVFLEDWFYETDKTLQGDRYFPAPTCAGHTPLQVIPTGPDCPNEYFQDMIVEAIYAARRRITITTPYLIPDEALLAALRMAAERDVEVNIILPERSDHPLVDLAGFHFCGYLLKRGVRIYQHRQGLLHAKTIAIDERFAMLGSANYNIRSFYLDFELNLSLYEPEVIRQLLAVQEGYLAESTPLTHRAWRRRSLLFHFAANLAKLLSPLF